MADKCRTCEYFDNMPERGEDEGICLRFPPAVSRMAQTGDLVSVHPPVKKTDKACGEYAVQA